LREGEASTIHGGYLSRGQVTGSLLQGSGPFSGTMVTTKHFQFTVTDAEGETLYFIEGSMQSATSLSGDYYGYSLCGEPVSAWS
jgi:hypothetical protein